MTVRTPIVKICLPGKNVNSTDPKDYAFHSNYSSIKIYKKFASTVTVAASSNATVTMNHSVGFFPLAVLYVELTPGSGRWYCNPFTNISGEETYVSGDFADTGVNATNAVFKIFNNTASQKIVSYYCFVLGHDGK